MIKPDPEVQWQAWERTANEYKAERNEARRLVEEWRSKYLLSKGYRYNELTRLPWEADDDD